jgi:hypothetical protein
MTMTTEYEPLSATGATRSCVITGGQTYSGDEVTRAEGLCELMGVPMFKWRTVADLLRENDDLTDDEAVEAYRTAHPA